MICWQLYLQDEKLMDTVPCILTTNLRTGSSDLHAFLKRIHSPKVDKWFVHWWVPKQYLLSGKYTVIKRITICVSLSAHLKIVYFNTKKIINGSDNTEVSIMKICLIIWNRIKFQNPKSKTLFLIMQSYTKYFTLVCSVLPSSYKNLHGKMLSQRTLPNPQQKCSSLKLLFTSPKQLD